MAEQKTFKNDVVIEGDLSIQDKQYLGLPITSGTSREIVMQGFQANIGLEITVKGTGLVRVPSGYEANIGIDDQALINRGYAKQYLFGKLGSALVQNPTATEDQYAVLYDLATDNWDLKPVSLANTYTDGLTKTGTTVRLGGDVDETLTNVRQIAIGDIYIQSEWGTQPAGLRVTGVANNDNQVDIFYHNTSRIRMRNDSFVITANVTDAMKYAADYSGLFTTRSIPDVDWVNKHIGGKEVTSLVYTPTGTEDGWVVYWDNPLGKYSLKVTSSLNLVAVRKNSTGGDIGSRRRINFIEGSNITMTIADDAVSNEIDVTINSTGGGGSGTVTTFSAGNLSPLFTTNVANASTTPALTFTITNQNANLVYAGPTAGGVAAPTFRSLVLNDIPSLSTLYLPLTGGTLTGALTLAADAANALQPVTLQQMNAALVGLWDDRGNFNASVNAYPSSGGSGVAGAILKGDIWTVSVAGTLPTGQVVEPGDTVRALIDTPGNTQGNWAIGQQNLGYTPISNVLNSGQIIVGNVSNVAAAVSMSGEASIINTGAVTLSNAAVIGKLLTGYAASSGTISATDSILTAIQKADGNAWKITGTTTLTGVATIISNSPNQHIFNGNWSANNNNQFHLSLDTTITSRASSGDVAIGLKISPSFVASAGTQTLIGLSIQPSWNDNGQVSIVHQYIRCWDGTRNRFSVTDGNVTFSSSNNTLTITNGLPGPAIEASAGTLILNTLGSGITFQISSTSWLAIGTSTGILVQPVTTTVTSTATQQNSRNLNWVVKEWTGAVEQVNYWTSRGTMSTTVQGESYWDMSYGTTGGAPSLSNLHMRLTNTGNVVFGLGTATTFVPTARFHVRGAGTTTGTLARLEDSAANAKLTVLDDGGFSHVTNVRNNVNWTGSWTADNTNLRYHYAISPTIQANTNNGNIVSAFVVNPIITAGAGTQILNAIDIRPTFNDNAQINIVHSYIRAFNGTAPIFHVRDDSTIFSNTAGTTNLSVSGGNFITGSAGIGLDTGTAASAVTMLVNGASYFAATGIGSGGIYVYQNAPAATTSTATQRSSLPFSLRVTEWTGATSQINFWTHRATQSTVTNQLSYYDIYFGASGTAPGYNNMHLRIRNTDGAVLIGAMTGTSLVPAAQLNVRGSGTTTGLGLLLEDSAGTDRFGFSDAGRFFMYTTPNNDNALTMLLAHDNVTGEIKYRDVSSITGGSGLSFQQAYAISSLRL